MEDAEIEYYSVPVTSCAECGEQRGYGAYDGDVFFCNDCWDAYEIQKQEKKKKKKRKKETEKYREQIENARERSRQEMENTLKREEEERQNAAEVRRFLQDTERMKTVYKKHLEENDQIPPPIPWNGLHFDADEIVPVLLELLYDASHIQRYDLNTLMEWFILLYYTREANSKLGQRIIQAFIRFRPRIRNEDLNKVTFIKRRMPKIKGGNLQNAAVLTMLMTDCEYFMNCIEEQDFDPKLPDGFYALLYNNEWIREYVSPNFRVDPYYCTTSSLFSEVTQTAPGAHCIWGPWPPMAKRHVRYSEWLIRYEFKRYYTSSSSRPRNMTGVKEIIEWCLRRKADFSNSHLLPVFLTTQVPSAWTIEIGFLVSQGSLLPENYEFQSIIAKRVYKRSLKASRKIFRDTARAVGRGLRRYEDINEIIVFMIVDFVIASSGQFIEAS